MKNLLLKNILKKELNEDLLIYKKVANKFVNFVKNIYNIFIVKKSIHLKK